MRAIPCIILVLFPWLPALSAPVIVNEFNAVSSTRTLAGGAADSVFGEVVENGGDWFELVVVGTGAGSTVDMRGWKVELQRRVVAPFTADDMIVLSSDSRWASVRAGTILTFTESRATEGGMDTALDVVDRRATEGWAHSNIWVGDPELIVYTDPETNGYDLDPVAGVSGVNLNDEDTQIRILDGSGAVVFGPAGEGVMPVDDEISKEETFLLQQTPSPAVEPTSDYGDGSDAEDRTAFSTFGRPNRWSAAGDEFVQSFAGFRSGAAPPVFLSSRRDALVFTGDLYSYQVRATDVDGDALVLQMTEGPGFLSLTDDGDGSGLLAGTPGPADGGIHPVRLRASDTMHGVHEQAFVLTVLPARATVIVNEYNAVSSTEGLGEDWSFDQRFGRVRGNGDDWIELVVVGDGAAGSTVDMRGWRIEIVEQGEPAGTIALNGASYWQAVPAGTILTFTESDTAGGGLDTSLMAEDRRAVEGWSWSNVHIRDESLIDRTVGNGAVGIVGDDTRITILDAAGGVVTGPCGEGLFSAGAVSNREVFRLAADPSPTSHPLTPQYGDADTSTFGYPNRLPENDGAQAGLPAGTGTGYQSFTAFATGVASAPPFFTNGWGTADVNNTLPGVPWIGPVISAADPDHAPEALTFSLPAAPVGVVLADNGDGTASLSWTPGPADIGVHEIAIEVRDPAGASLTHTVRVAVMPPSSPVLVNEYNAVSGGRFLNSGTVEQDLDGGTAMDAFFGRVEGNGGDWIELVVVGDGTAGSTVDMRGWQVVVSEFDAPVDTIVLGQHPYLGAVRAGTILTLVDRDASGGGLDSAIHRVNRFGDLGYAWTNIVVGDPEFVDQTASAFGSTLSLGDTETEITLRDAGGAVVGGPAGEPRIMRNVSPDEVFHLERDPAPGVTGSVADAGYPDYADHLESSSFGAPNRWQEDVGGIPGEFVQDFSAFAGPGSTNSRPTFTRLPDYRYGVPGRTHSQPVEATDSDGTAGLVLSLVDTPGWVSLVDLGNGSGTLEWTPPGRVTGARTVSIRVTDGVDPVVRTFSLFIHPATAPVVLNEYNAVSASSFLNDGTAGADGAGGTASDARFGRVAGNGGDWFELVVVGDDAPGTLDMRGWTIEVAAEAGFPFAARALIELSGDPYWAAVPHGTILTFTEDRSAQGGMDTAINALDRRATEGWGWSNIWIGDPRYVTYTGEEANGYLRDPARGVISDFDITSSGTQFVVRDAGGGIACGPVGEGVAPVSGVTSQGVWELVADPRSGVTPHDAAAAGFDGSTFGRPNEWGGGAAVQDFSVFINRYAAYAAAAGLSGDEALIGADADDDGVTNGQEFAHGSDPGDPASRPLLLMEESGTLVFLRRVGGTMANGSYRVDGIGMEVLYSTDLVNWSVTERAGEVPAGLPVAPAGYEYAGMALPLAATGAGEAYMRVGLSVD